MNAMCELGEMLAIVDIFLLVASVVTSVLVQLCWGIAMELRNSVLEEFSVVCMCELGEMLAIVDIFLLVASVVFSVLVQLYWDAMELMNAVFEEFFVVVISRVRSEPVRTKQFVVQLLSGVVV